MKTVRELLIIAALMFGMAWLFVTGWDRQEFVDQARRAERLSQLVEGR